MENDILEKKKDLTERILNIIKQKRKSLILFLIFIIIIISGTLFLRIYEKKMNTKASEDYVKAGIYLISNKKEESKIIYKNIIYSKNKLYSLLALNSILENNLETNNSEVLKLFKIIEDIKITKEQKDLIKLKKAFYLIKNSMVDEGEKILKEIISSDSAWKKIAVEASR
ncbi:MAG: hypothetical protein ACJZ8J_02870 [Candidatus Pelagibacter sp.]|tara:strand:- start:650 stop:1159 length:510 start_codon:yes stop_codon:yes gene_type:complete